MLQVISHEATTKRSVFFEAMFEGLEGYLCLGAKKADEARMIEEFFKWPEQEAVALDFVQRFTRSHNLYFCPTLFSNNKRSKENAIDGWVAWCDLDPCAPEKVEETPTFVMETSPNRFQALWKFDSPVNPYDLEDISRRIAYKYEDEGADRNCWKLTQLYRVPFTYNHKYAVALGTAPTVTISAVNKVEYGLAHLQEELPQVDGYEVLDIPMPEAGDLPEEDADDIMQKYRKTIQPLAFSLFSTQPERKQWSEALWQLEMFCLEAGMSLEEAFVVARASACNKYKRDNKSEVQLWKEICRAQARFDEALAVQMPSKIDQLLTDADRKAAEEYRTIVDEYIDWAKGVGDAAPQYHQAGAFILLSSLIAGPVKLPTSFGVIVPNLWFMIMADTTLTRKSTAMDLAMDLLVEIDSEAIMATDGSIEGLLTTLQFRPGRPSIFLRDEFSGLLESMTKKDYYAGMAETFTKLYDGKFQKRVLRREVIELRDPVLILFAGGIRDRILQLLQYEHVSSGFIPRFIFITAESDVTRLRPLGPPSDHTLSGRDDLIAKFTDLYNHYSAPQLITVNGKQLPAPAEWHASLTDEAWALYNHYETKMMQDALQGEHPELLTPMFDRLSKSGLKAAVLLACLRQEERLVVSELDIIKAFSYVEQWRMTAVEILNNLGRTASERHLQQVMRAIQKQPGLLRSKLMQQYHLSARDTEAILMTLEQRGSIQRVKHGRTERLNPTVIPNQNH
jgi:hypothetical protein